jgi:hypothetical protein
MTPVTQRGNQTAGGRWIAPSEKKPGGDVASRTDSATVNLAAFSVEDATQIDAALQVTAAGTTLTVKLQTTLDPTGAAGWYDVGTFPAVTTVSTVQQSFGGNLGVLARWVVSAITGSFTWNIDHQARLAIS